MNDLSYNMYIEAGMGKGVSQTKGVFMLNTMIPYMYRDAGNNKMFGEVVLRGEMNPKHLEEFKKLMVTLDGNLYSDQGMCYFVPPEIGWPELTPSEDEWDYDLDHDFHEIWFDEIKSTDAEPTEEMSVEALLEFLRRASGIREKEVV